MIKKQNLRLQDILQDVEFNSFEFDVERERERKKVISDKNLVFKY